MCHELEQFSAQQGEVQFTENVTISGLGESNLEYDPDQSETSDGDFNFWINQHEYTKAETIARCIKATTPNIKKDIVREFHAYESNTSIHSNKPRIHIPEKRDWESLKPYFTWIPTKLIEPTFKHSTQYGYMPASPDGNLFKRWHSPNPAMNVFRINNNLLTDKVYSDTAAMDSGHTEAQIFFGRQSHIIHVEPISKEHPFLSCLQNFVRKWGAPRQLLGDHAGNQSSSKVMDYLCILWIGFWCSEAYYQHQNMFER